VKKTLNLKCAEVLVKIMYAVQQYFIVIKV